MKFIEKLCNLDLEGEIISNLIVSAKLYEEYFISHCVILSISHEYKSKYRYKKIKSEYELIRTLFS